MSVGGDPMPKIGDEIVSQKTGRKARWDGQGWALITQDPGGMDVLGGGYKQAPSGQLFKEGKSGSMTRVAGPTDTQIGEASKKLSGINAALQAVDRVDKAYRSNTYMGPGADWFNPQLQQAVEDLGLRLKEDPYNLGVLNGPDLMLIRRIVGDPMSIREGVNRKGFEARLRQLAKILGDSYRAEAQRYGGMGGKAESLGTPLYQASDSRYTREQWGTRGQVPFNALAPTQQRGGKPQSNGWGEMEVVN